MSRPSWNLTWQRSIILFSGHNLTEKSPRSKDMMTNYRFLWSSNLMDPSEIMSDEAVILKSIMAALHMLFSVHNFTENTP